GGSLVDAGTGAVMIRNATGGLDITLGAVQAGTLSLTDAELDSIQGDSLRIGRLDLDNAANSAGDITVAGALSAAPALLSKLLLFAGGNVLQTGGGLSAQAIGIEVGGSVTLDGNNDAIQ